MAALSTTSPDSRQTRPELSPREWEVCKLIAMGHSSKAVADRLQVSTRTVDSHRWRAYRNLGATTVQEITLLMVRLGIVSPADVQIATAHLFTPSLTLDDETWKRLEMLSRQ